MKPLPFTFHPGHHVHLREYDTTYHADIPRKDGEAQLESLAKEIDNLQELLYAAGTHRLLVILQGMDTSGKDGTIRHVLQYVSPLGCRVKSFKTPTEEELAHDFLWRVHHAVPRVGEVVFFNRSHYEDVLFVRVHKLVPEQVWRKRYQHINDFERLLVENNVLVLKFFLHISKEEQKERLLEREQSVTKAWKLSPVDWNEREYWDEYQTAYEDVLRECHTTYAPWHIVPADRKWFRNLAIAQTIVDTLQPFKYAWIKQLEEIQVRALQELEQVAERRSSRSGTAFLA